MGPKKRSKDSWGVKLSSGPQWGLQETYSTFINHLGKAH